MFKGLSSLVCVVSALAAGSGLIQASQDQQAAPPPPPLVLPIEMSVPSPPTPFMADGKTHLVYELHMTNFAARELTLSRLEVLGSNDNVLAQYENKDLADRIRHVGKAPNVVETRVGAGLRAVAFLWLTVDTPASVPAILRHRLTAKLTATVNSTAGDIDVTGQSVPLTVRKLNPPTISAPLRGEGWVAANGPSNTSGHRRTIIPSPGGPYIAQRLAIDWVQLRETGRTFEGDREKNESYKCYGSEVLAVADGTVVATKDGIPQNVPGPTRAVPITLETSGGNHVVLDIGDGYFAFYAHLQPASLRVREGDEVKRGQVLGLVGNSGNSTEPHLHFQMMDAKSPLLSEGLPYHLDRFEVQGKGRGWKDEGRPAEKRLRELPLQDAVIRFVPPGRS